MISLFSITVANWPNVSKLLGGNPQNINSDPLALLKYLPQHRESLKRHLWVGILARNLEQNIVQMLMERAFTITFLEQGCVISASLHTWEFEVVALSRLEEGRDFANRIYNGFRSMKMDLWFNYRKNLIGKEVEFATVSN